MVAETSGGSLTGLSGILQNRWWGSAMTGRYDEGASLSLRRMILQFGDFVLDTGARLLRRGDQPIHLRAKTFDLLLLLVAERPKALSKSDLIERLWPGTYVQEANLSNSIGELRKALGDRSARPRFIRTVHTSGYAFAADVEEQPAEGFDQPAAESISEPVRLIWGTRVIALTNGERIVGRDDSADIVLPEATVSRRHARLRITGASGIVEDLGSQNGTWVNDRKVTEPTPLTDGDRIRFGLALVTYRSGGAAFTTERIPE
jgi:DNA-binding winged helix-turn-helix (wHTH) protein